MYQDSVQILKIYMMFILELDSDVLLTIYNGTDHAPIKQLRPHFNLAASCLLESSAAAVFLT